MPTDLQVNQTNGRINLDIKPPNMSMQTKHAADFKLNQNSGKLEVKTQDAKVDISTKQARAALNEKNYKIYSKDLAQKGLQDSMQGIARYAKQGDQLARIENGGQPLASQAKSNSEDNKKELALKKLPPPQINISDGGVRTDYMRSEVNAEAKTSGTKVDLNWGEVEKYLNPEPQIEIRAVDVKA